MRFGTIPLKTFNNVLLPEPEGPSISTFSLSLISSDKLSNIYFCPRSEEHTSELQSRFEIVCRLLLEKKKLDFPIALSLDKKGDQDATRAHHLLHRPFKA